MEEHWPNADEFAVMTPEEQQEVRDRSTDAVAEARAAVQEREAELRAGGASWAEICRDLRS